MGEVVGLWDKKERRRFKRLNTALDVRYEIFDNTKSVQEVVTRDISQGGVGLIIYEKLKEGTSLRIWLNLPRNKVRVLLLGDIVWLKEIIRENSDKRIFFVGVKFTAVDTVTQLKLFDLIDELEKEEKNKELEPKDLPR